MRNNYWSRRDLIERQRLFNLTENQLVKLLKKKYIKVAKDVQLRLQDIVIKIQSTNQPTANQLYIQDRLFKLYNELQNELIALGEFENKVMTGTFEDYYQNVFRQSTVAKNPVDELLIEPDKVQRAITSVWTGDAKNFSDRIWIHKRQLMAKLNDGLTNIVATGKNWAILSKEIAKDFNVAFNDSKRLVRTELTHIS